MDRSEPDGDNTTLTNEWCYDGRQSGFGGRCYTGHYCPIGTSYPIPCEAGTYSATLGKATCDQCVAGTMFANLCLIFLKFIMYENVIIHYSCM